MLVAAFRLSHAENVVEAESKQKALSLTEKIRELEDKLNTANARVEDLKISKTSYMKVILIFAPPCTLYVGA